MPEPREEFTPSVEEARRYYVRGRADAQESTGFFKRSDGRAWREEFDRMIAKQKESTDD